MDAIAIYVKHKWKGVRKVGGIFMQYKEFKDGIKLSRLGMGAMRLPVQEGKDACIDYDAAKKLIDKCMAQGINYYDTAYIYHGGKSEEFLGKALAEYPRDSYYVTDKFNFQAEPDYRKQFEEQLKRMNMNRIDFYLLHGVQDHFAEDMIKSGCIEFFDKKKKSGEISYLGFSFHGSADTLRKMLKLYDWDFVQIQLNYYDWYYGDARELYEILEEADIPIMVMEPVHGGLLANLTEEATKELRAEEPEDSLASWAMRWVMGLDQVQVVLSGMSEENQVDDNIHTFSENRELSEADQKLIKKVARIQRESVAVACTECRYCTPNCPKGLDIPFLLKNYNEAKIGGTWRLSHLTALPQEKLPSACINCKACTEHCPQGFLIPEYMKELAGMLKEL